MKNTENMAEFEDPGSSSAEADKPPSYCPRPGRSWRVAVIANLKGETALPYDAPADAGAEFDKKETIQAIQAAIESDGHTTLFLPADTSLPFTLRDFQPDICFNIAEGITGDGREAQVPALLELFRVPYTASRVVANGVALDKVMTKRIWHEMGLPTACYQEFATGDEPISYELRYPVFVKPAREGTGMGMDLGAICYDDEQLRRRVRWVVDNYHQPALVEDYLPGREFTVAVMGRKDAALFSRHPEWYGPDGFHRFPVLEVDSSRSVTPGIYGHKAKTLHEGDTGVPGFLCPADVDPALFDELQNLAIAAHQALGSLDVSRVDIRLDAENRPRLIEINTLPGLTPDFSDLCVISNAEGISYQELILEILYLGASRFGLLKAVEAAPEPISIPALVPVRFKYK